MQPCNTCLHWPAGQRPNRSPSHPVSLAPALPTMGFSIKLSAPPWPGHGGALLPRGAQQGRRLNHFVFVTSSWSRTEPPGSRGVGGLPPELLGHLPRDTALWYKEHSEGRAAWPPAPH